MAITTPLPGALNLTGYKLTFDDEFNSFSSNGPSNYQIVGGTGTWDTTLSYGERKLNDEVQLYSDPTTGTNPFSVQNGVMVIHAQPSPDPSKTWGQTYTSGMLTTNHSFSQEYGYFEMRAELPQGAGMWPAFWMLPQQHVWPPELDPLEAFGQTGPGGDGGATLVHSGFNTSTGTNQGQWNDTSGANLYTQYNTFGVDWEADKVTFYVNGHATSSYATPADFHQPMYMLANLAVGGHWAGAPAGESADMKIDYIRAFSKDGANHAVVQDKVSSPDGGGFDLYGATDANGHASTPVAAPPPADTLVLKISQDAWKGDAQYTVAVDGVQVGGTRTASALHSLGNSDTVTLVGHWGAGTQNVAVSFLNDAWGGTPDTDRNLYVDSVVYDGHQTAPGVTLWSTGTAYFTPSDPALAKAATLSVHLAEDAWKGDAQYSVSVDGKPLAVGGTVTALDKLGQSQAVDLQTLLAPGTHDVAVSFLNDAWGGTPDTDRNLMVKGIDYNGKPVVSGSTTLWSQGTTHFQFMVPS